jgi:hypothetical protein
MTWWFVRTDVDGETDRTGQPRTSARRPAALELANAPQDKRIGEMSVHKMNFVVVNDMAPRNPSVCAACSRPLERGYLHDLSTSKRYCGVECYPLVSGFVGSVAPTNAFELAVAWPRLTVDVASALFDSAWGDRRG